MNNSESIKALLLPHIRRIKPYSGVDPMEAMAEQAGIAPEKVIRLNGNENPYGPSPRVAEALGAFPHYNHYPDQDQRALRQGLSEYLSVDPNRIVAGNGSDELIDLILRMFVGPGDNIIIPTPTFGMYAFSAEVCGGEVISVDRDESFEIDLENMRTAATANTKATFFPSPNNPSGNMASEAQIKGMLDTGMLVVVDEAYYEFCGETAVPLVEEYPNLVVLRTFSKWAGLAGLRIGLGVMHPELAATMMGMKPPYNVNLASEVALLASLKDRPGLMERVDSIVAERDRMMDLLKKIPGVNPWPSRANFILCQLPQDRGKEIFEGLCRKGIFLRHWNTPQLKDFVRASVGLPDETDAVVKALQELVGE